ncbi:MAG TPA: hypothetical protein VM450_19275 [Thermomicrobiales bacterium]|nr:hypothetical protein [Thermomicrobiales bacterium]
MDRASEHPTIIELDDPTPRGMRVMAAFVVVLVIVLVIAPFIIDDGASGETQNAPQPAVRAAQPEVCRPSVDVPSLLDPVAGFALPSWMRLCDWFIGPAISEPAAPPN